MSPSEAMEPGNRRCGDPADQGSRSADQGSRSDEEDSGLGGETADGHGGEAAGGLGRLEPAYVAPESSAAVRAGRACRSASRQSPMGSTPTAAHAS
jgi:hypothetical protein